MTKFRNNKSNKNQGIHTIFGQHSVKAALQNDKREHFELIISSMCSLLSFCRAALTECWPKIVWIPWFLLDLLLLNFVII